MKRAFLLGTVAMLSGCLNVAEPPDEPTDPATETFATSTGVDIATMTKTSTGVYYKDLEVGTGNAVKGGEFVSITFLGFLTNGYVFDRATQTITRKLSDVIVGFNEGMVGMQVGGSRKIVIPSGRAYGQFGFPAYNIPPNSTLVYDVHLFDLP
jgi:FKBP-type peptidyl-prolyl cis-trans isomerase